MSTLYNNFIGIDIGKLELVMNIHGSKTTYTYANNQDGLEQLYSEHTALLQGALVLLEVTGGYEKVAISYLQQRHIAVHRANGRQIKSFIRSLGTIAKSDAIDARALSFYAAERHAKLKLYEPNAHEILRELSERRSDLVHIRSQEINRSKAPSGSWHNSFAPIRQVLDEQIAALEKQIQEIIELDPELGKKAKVLKSVSGIGPITANELLAHIPEIGTMNQKQVASLAGVAPHPNQSGTREGYRRTRGGRRKVRSVLYMSALAASRGKSALGEFYRHLISNGKRPLCALVAVMRKIVVIGNARIKEALRDTAAN